MLATLHEALRDQPQGADLCTVCLVTLERSRATALLTVALAGHPPPLLIAADGSARQIGTPGTLLGVIDPIEIHDVQAELGAGETLLLYTDGLPEAGGAEQPRQPAASAQLRAQLSGMALAGALERIAHEAVERADGHPRDDIALLGVRMSASERAAGG